MERKILDFARDEAGDWIARLECGHQQHIRHNPPWITRPWVLTAAGRQEKIGAILECPECDREEEKTGVNPGSPAG